MPDAATPDVLTDWRKVKGIGFEEEQVCGRGWRMPGSKVQQGIDACLVKPYDHLAVYYQGGYGANTHAEQFIAGLFVDHQIFSHEFHPLAGQILCQCRTGASEGL